MDLTWCNCLMTIGGARTFVSQAWTKDSGDRLWFEVVRLMVSVFFCQRCLSLIVAWGSGQSGTLGRIFFLSGLSRTHISDLDRSLLVLSCWLADIMRNGIAVLVPFELLVWCSRVDLRVALTRWRFSLQISSIVLVFPYVDWSRITDCFADLVAAIAIVILSTSPTAEQGSVVRTPSVLTSAELKVCLSDLRNSQCGKCFRLGPGV